METDKRFWVFINGHIEFMDNLAVWSAMVCMFNYGLGAVGLFATNDRNKPKNGLRFTETGWVPGHFMLIDSNRVGEIELADDVPVEAIDRAYSMEIKAMGYAVGIAPGLVYKDELPKEISEEATAWLVRKYGEFYIHNANPVPTV